MFRIDLAVLFLSVVHNISTQQLYSDDFAFPLEKTDDLTTCTFANGTAGRCVTDCPNARHEYQLGISPTICRFENELPIVCCRKDTVSPLLGLFKDASTTDTTTKDPQLTLDTVRGRKSVVNCDRVYSLPVPFRNIRGLLHVNVVGGQKTLRGEFPHMAALGWSDYVDKKISWRCGGTLISEDFILTAAHCVIGRSPPDIIRIGAKDLISPDILDIPLNFGIESIIGHPNYIPNKLYDDIALIKLNKSATIDTRVRPACLWQETAIDFTEATAIGYGHTEFGGVASNKLLKVDLKIVNNTECNTLYQNERSLNEGILASQLCAGDFKGEKDTCQGDSGGPIQVSTKNGMQLVYHVIGITSFGKACAVQPGVYTRVSHYLDWIESIVWP